MSKESVTWLQVNNWVPIIVMAVTVTITYGALFTRIAIIETKMDNLVTLNKEILDKYSSVESRYGTLTLKVRTLEERHNINQTAP